MTPDVTATDMMSPRVRRLTLICLKSFSISSAMIDYARRPRLPFDTSAIRASSFLRFSATVSRLFFIKSLREPEGGTYSGIREESAFRHASLLFLRSQRSITSFHVFFAVPDRCVFPYGGFEIFDVAGFLPENFFLGIIYPINQSS